MESAIHILLKCPETNRCRYILPSNEWVKINEEVAYKKTIECSNVNKLRGLGMYLYRVRCLWEKERPNLGERIEDGGGGGIVTTVGLFRICIIPVNRYYGSVL
jgi:hypothetical protein